jgi:pimeloyl-ACP methyl ester carboxylesterase
MTLEVNGFCFPTHVNGPPAGELVEANLCRLAEPGALTAALNWYRALNFETRIGPIFVPTLFTWGSQDMAVGATAAMRTADYVTGPYRFEQLEERSHWLVDEVPDLITSLVLDQIRTTTLHHSCAAQLSAG